MGDILDELNDIVTKAEKIVAEVATDLYNELVQATPVDTGILKGGWEINRQNDGSWIINNPMEYAEIRLSPLIEEDGKAIRGSFQFPAGIVGIIDKYDRILQKRLKAI